MKKICLILTILLTLSVLSPFSAALAAEDPEIQASAALLVEQTTGSVLYSKNASERVEQASVTKLMTALLAAEAYENGEFELTDTVTVSNNAFSGVETKSSLKFSVGEEIEIYDVLACCMIASVNESCNMIAEFVAGDIDSFVELMNERAAELGCKDTHFVNAHGMPDPNHYTTAYDTYLLLSEVLQHKLITGIWGKTTWMINATNKSAARNINASNKLLDKSSVYYYEQAIGGKTGFTSSAGYCLASVAEQDDLQLLSIVLGTEGVKNEDDTTTIMSFVETRRLFKWGFSEFGYRTVLDTSDLVAEVPVSMGDGAGTVVLRPNAPMTVYMDLSIPVDELEREITMFSDKELTAPINAGDSLGEITLSYNGQVIGKETLVANSDVKLLHIELLRSEIKAFFRQTWVRLMLVAATVVIIAYIVFVIRYNSDDGKKRRKKRHKNDKKSENKPSEQRNNGDNVIHIDDKIARGNKR